MIQANVVCVKFRFTVQVCCIKFIVTSAWTKLLMCLIHLISVLYYIWNKKYTEVFCCLVMSILVLIRLLKCLYHQITSIFIALQVDLKLLAISSHLYLNFICGFLPESQLYNGICKEFNICKCFSFNFFKIFQGSYNLIMILCLFRHLPYRQLTIS